MRTGVSVIAALAFMTSVATAQQAGNAWSMAASACVHADRHFELHEAQPGLGVGFGDGKTGYIPFTCPVTSMRAVTTLVLTYRDPDGRAEAAQVRAYLTRMDLVTGYTSVVGEIIDSNRGEVSQSARPPSTMRAVIAPCGRPMQFDYTAYAYSVVLEVRRLDTAVIPYAYAVSMYGRCVS